MCSTTLGVGAMIVLAVLGAAPQNDLPYVPLGRAPDTIRSHEEPGTVSGDFKRAQSSETRAKAVERWEGFFAVHGTGEYEDGFHARRVRSAKFELARLYYLAGKADRADALLRELMLSE